MKKLISISLFIIGLIVIYISIKFLIVDGIIGIIESVKTNAEDSVLLAWSIVKIFPLFEIVFFLGGMVLFSGISLYFEN